MVKVYLSRKGIPFTERNVSLSETDAEALLALGRTTTPVTTIGESIIVGYKPKDIDAAEKKQAHKAYRADLAIAQENRSIAKHIYDKRQQLHSKGYTSTLQLLEAEKNLNDLTGNVQRLENQILLSESEIGQFQSRLSSLDATQRDEAYDALSEVAAEQQEEAGGEDLGDDHHHGRPEPEL